MEGAGELRCCLRFLLRDFETAFAGTSSLVLLSWPECDTPSSQISPSSPLAPSPSIKFRIDFSNNRSLVEAPCWIQWLNRDAIEGGGGTPVALGPAEASPDDGDGAGAKEEARLRMWIAVRSPALALRPGRGESEKQSSGLIFDC